MSNRIYLTSTEVLAALRSAFTSFDDNSNSAMASIASEIEETRIWLLDRKDYWQREVAEAERELSITEDSLRSCEASGYYDEDGDFVEPDCSSEASAVMAAQNRLFDATTKLDNVVHWEQRVEYGIHHFEGAAAQFVNSVTHQAQDRQRFLDRKIQQYDAAAAISQRSQLVSGQNTSRATTHLSPARNVAQIDIKGSSEEQRLLSEALLKLAQVQSAGQLIETLVELGTQVSFARPNELEDRHCWAVFDKTVNRITLCHSLSNHRAEIIAPHLAHEATHALWYRPSSIDQEYHAFKAQAEVWSALKNGLEDFQNDQVQIMVGWGEEACKRELRGYPSYSNYPESV